MHACKNGLTVIIKLIILNRNYYYLWISSLCFVLILNIESSFNSDLHGILIIFHQFSFGRILKIINNYYENNAILKFRVWCIIYIFMHDLEEFHMLKQDTHRTPIVPHGRNCNNNNNFGPKWKKTPKCQLGCFCPEPFNYYSLWLTTYCLK